MQRNRPEYCCHVACLLVTVELGVEEEDEQDDDI